MFWRKEFTRIMEVDKVNGCQVFFEEWEVIVFNRSCQICQCNEYDIAIAPINEFSLSLTSSTRTTSAKVSVKRGKELAIHRLAA